MKLLSLIGVFFILNENLINCEFFTSTDELAKLLSNKAEIIGSLKGFIGDLERGTKDLKGKLSSLTSEQKILTKNPQSYVENPLNAFILIKTLSHDIEDIKFNFREAFKQLNNAAKDNQLQNIELDGVVDAFVRLQEVYKLSLEDFAFGIVDGKKVRRQLTIDQILLIADLLKKKQKFEFAEKFYKIALEKEENDDEKYKIAEKLFALGKADDDFTKAAHALTTMQKLKPENSDEIKKLALQLQKLNEKDPKEEFKFEGTYYTDEKSEFIFSQACSGNRRQNASITSKLFCDYRSTSAFTKIAPFKVEILNFEPFVGIFHDVIADSEISCLKNISIGEMSDAGVGKDSVNYIRNAKFKTFKDDENEVVGKISKRVGDMTGLKMESVEDLNIFNYGIGGYDKMHFDFDLNGNSKVSTTGNRIATVMFYLSDVEKGGATIFPFLRLFVQPVKGTAIFWHNLSTSGDREYLTLHGSCPVILGSKWVVNKKIREHGEEFTRPCELQRKPTNDRYDRHYYTL